MEKGFPVDIVFLLMQLCQSETSDTEPCTRRQDRAREVVGYWPEDRAAITNIKEVNELPPGAEVIAHSDKMGIEMFRFGDHIMGIQDHPEYTKDILLHLIDLLQHRALITESYADDLKANIGPCKPDKEAWTTLCIGFLKGTTLL